MGDLPTIQRSGDVEEPSRSAALQAADDRSQEPRLHAVLVTYRRPHDLVVMLDALEDLKDLLDSVVVVDNDPSDETQSRVMDGRRRPRCSYLGMRDNTGPAGGIAAGMSEILKLAADDDWVLVLDDDDPPNPAAVRRLWKFCREMRSADPSVAGVGLSGSRMRRSGRLERLPNDELEGPAAVHYIGGNQCPMYLASAIRAVGVFDSALFFGLDDLEYGLRLRSHGWRLYADGAAVLASRIAAGSIDKIRRPRLRRSAVAWRRYYSLRNLVIILRREKMPVQALAITFLAVVKALLGPLVSRQDLAGSKLVLLAALHGWRGKTGRTVDPTGYGS